MTTATAPARTPLGGGFRRLWTASAFSNLADGIGRVALPLAAAQLTDDPLIISVLTATAFVPWLVFGIPSGMIVDRFDRRVVMAGANVVRGAVAVWLAVLALGGQLTIAALIVGTLVFGLGETLFDNASNAVVPALVGRSGLDRANGWMQASQVTVDSFLAAPIGGVLFAVAVAFPLGVGAVGYLVPICLALLLPAVAARAATAPAVDGPETVPSVAPGPVPGAGGQTSVPAREAWRYLVGHRYLRGMVLLTAIVGSALTFAQATSILFLLDELRIPAAGIGFATAGIGAGALIGSLLAPGLVARFGRGPVMLTASVLAGALLAVAGLMPEVWSAMAAYSVGAAAASAWNVPWGAIRQQIVPGHLFGRVLGIIRTVTWGVFPVAVLLGGLVARIDLRMPFVVGGGVVVVAALVASRLIVRGTREAEAASDQANSSSSM